MITDREIQAFWNRWDSIIICWTLFSLVTFLSGIVAVAFILKHYCGVKTKFWVLNDTEDGDFGAKWWLMKKGLQPGLKSAFLWYLRNHSWNLICKIKPEWESGEAEDLRIIRSTIDHEKHGPFTWCTKAGIHGIHYVAYRINGKVYCRYSYATPNKEKIFGAGGDRYKCKIR